ncbi:hypothetical protein CQW23_19029 [Capsicum baccatum]|uniref:Aminotransferase-like plant mobile domain-containing protein n=1 Tax=Capsicum baccatum TaxID=33114 RepID=A0A2G2W4L9_CAPBA|nr:hypothetical protein CQW23_19029 [Capsicum baccatum]
MLGDKVACDWPKTCHLGHLAMFYWLLNLTWIATSFDVCGLASLVFNLTGMPHHLTRGISLGLKAFYERWHSSTNTIYVGIGELSVSLWDMRMIGSLPVHRTFFDEVVPLTKELSQTYQQGKPFLPKTCAYLFSEFYQLSNGASKEVSVHDWVNFWFKGPERYTEPPPRGPKKHAKSNLNHSPNGYIDMSFLPRTEKENVSFVELGVEGSLEKRRTLLLFLLVGFASSLFQLRNLTTSIVASLRLQV